MRDVVVFPDATAAVLAWLRNDHGHDTGLNLPVDETISGPLITGRRAGGASADVVVDNATVVLEFWDDTDRGAMRLALAVRGLLLAISDELVVTDEDETVLIKWVTELGGPAHDPDPHQRSPRVTATFTVATRGVAALGST